MSYASDTEEFEDIGGARWVPGREDEFSTDGDSEYTQSDEGGEDELEELGLHDDPSDSTDEEVEDRPPSDSGRDDLDQQGAVQFDRLIKSIKSTTDLTSATPFLDDQAPEPDADDVDDDFMSGLRAATGVGKRKAKLKRGHRQPSPSPAAQDLLGKANMAYVMHDWLAAINSFQQVIHEEPSVPAAWIGLGMCHRELGNPEKALQCEIVGAHLVVNGETWKELGKKSRESGAAMQALYCYKKALDINPKDVDALWDRSVVFREIGEHVKAIEGFGLILNQFPNDVAILQEMAHSFVEANRISLGQRLILTALHTQQARYPLPAEMPDQAELFSIPVIVILFDLLFASGKYNQALRETKKAVRWLQGRHDQVRWTTKEDDSEFDVAGHKRRPHAEAAPGYPLDINVRQRLGLVRLKLKQPDEARRHFEFIRALDPSTYMIFWSEVAAAFLEAKLYDDALGYYEALAQITSDPHHVEGRGDCLRAVNDLEGASESYEFASAAFEGDDESLSRVQLKLAAVYEPLGRRREALDLVTGVLERQQKKRAQAELDDEEELRGNHAPGGSLTSFFDEEKQMRDKARVAALHRKREREQATQVVIEDSMLAKVQAGFTRLAQLDEAVDAGMVEAVEEWLEIARELVEGFRQTRLLFPADKNVKYTGIDSKGKRPGFRSKTFKKRRGRMAVEDEAAMMSQRLRRELEGDAATSDDFDATKLRGVDIALWFEMCIKFCCILAKNDEAEYAVEVADHLCHSNLFRSREQLETLRVVSLGCQMRIADPNALVDSARRIFIMKQFNNAASHLLVSTLTPGVESIEALSSYNLQKLLLRELRLWKAAPEEGKLVWNTMKARWHPGLYAAKGKQKASSAAATSQDEDDDASDSDGDGRAASRSAAASQPRSTMNMDPIKRPTKPSPVLFTYYGALMMVAKSYQSAMYYLTHAHIIDPWDPLICFHLALCYLGRAFQRQCDNRNHCIAQMVAFLGKYRANHLLGPDCDEVDYNFGTVFHRLGLFHLAKAHFIKILERAEVEGRTGAEPDSLIRETAFNLSLIHNMTPAPAEAKRVMRRWLSI